ncbi:MAG: V-type ATP synthase subunit D [Candidatus Omnitrophota bacterium]
MPKIKYTKGELKRQRDSLAQFRRYLPTLQLKKQQLQIKVFEMRAVLEMKQGLLTGQEHGVLQWVGILADPALHEMEGDGFDLKKYTVPLKVETGQENIAGAHIPVLKKITFADPDYDLYETPFWIDMAVPVLKELTSLAVEVRVIEEALRCLQRELRITTQRVNLFEKVKIPEAIEHIRQITIYLGDQQANAVGISKVAKRKLEQAQLAPAV